MSELTSKQKGFMIVVLDFCEENWDMFTSRCEDSGIPLDEIEHDFDKLRKKVHE